MKVYLNHSENLHFIGSAREFSNIHMDEPESFHGTNKGPSPVEYFLLGIGGCMASTFVFCCQKNEIEIHDISITIDGQLTHREDRENLLQFQKIEGYIMFIPKHGEQNKQAIKQCINDFQKYCVVSNSLRQGIPLSVNVNWNKGK
ncbi:MAG: OsmC family protein [Promethearchaeia archaeon]